MRAFILGCTALIVMVSTASSRDLTLIEEASEISLRYVTLPTSSAGSILLGGCEGCGIKRLRVSGTTTYEFAGGAMPLADFRRSVDAFLDANRANADALVGVYYDLETNIVTRVIVVPPQ